jgi:hypothetical protein
MTRVAARALGRRETMISSGPANANSRRSALWRLLTSYEGGQSSRQAWFDCSLSNDADQAECFGSSRACKHQLQQTERQVRVPQSHTKYRRQAPSTGTVVLAPVAGKKPSFNRAESAQVVQCVQASSLFDGQPPGS